MSTLFAWPPAAAVGKTIAKAKLVEQASGPSRLRRELTERVDGIRWAFKLSPGTIGLPPTDNVPEIQVIAVDAKSDDVPQAALTAIDRAILTPTVFEVHARRGAGAPRVRMAAAFGPVGAPESGRPWHNSGWLAADAPRVPLPPALNLEGLYAHLIAALLPVERPPGEPIAHTVQRAGEVDRRDREIARLTAKMRAEPQFNRQVEMRRRVQALQSERDALAAAVQNETEVSPWTS